MFLLKSKRHMMCAKTLTLGCLVLKNLQIYNIDTEFYYLKQSYYLKLLSLKQYH